MSVSSSSHSILADKVGRALEVRTDTPAMRAALEALGHLPQSETMDSRSVRVAIEQDALQQALLLQEELRSLVETVSALRKGVSASANIATQVSAAIQTNVVKSVSITDGDMDDGGPTTIPQLSPDDALAKEEQLAALLNEAFVMQREAAKRSETVVAFLEKFDLSEQDSMLLETYSFDDVALSMGGGSSGVDGSGMDTSMNAGGEQMDGMAFLDALERVGKIRRELADNFGGGSSTSGDSMILQEQSEQQQDAASHLGATSALRMMESLSVKQERAYERLYHWLQRYLHLNATTHVPTSGGGSGSFRSSTTSIGEASVPAGIDGDAMDEALSHPFVKRSLQVLRHVPAFYSHLVELISSSRRSEETRRFLLALTSGYGGRSPIEMKAHDPVNYVGDMLAFCFQSCSVEADVVRGLVAKDEDGLDGPGEGVEESKELDDDEFGAATSSRSTLSMTATDMLAHAMSGLARPLKSRILQVVVSLARRPDDDEGEDDDEDGGVGDMEDEEDAIVRTRVANLYSICGLLLFYRSAIDKAVSKLDAKFGRDEAAPLADNPLVEAIHECLQEASQAYVASVKVYAAMLESLSLICGDSESSLVHSMLEQISNVRMASPGFAPDVRCPEAVQRSLGIDFVTETLLESALSLCKALDDAVTLKMSLAMSKRSGGLGIEVASTMEERIAQTEKTLVDDLVKAETEEVLEICGLSPIVAAWKSARDDNPEDEVDGGGLITTMESHLSVDDLDSALKDFYASLYSPPIPSFENIQDPILRKLARSKIASNVVNTYRDLYEAISNEKLGGYGNDLSFLGHTPSQVKTLFSV